MVPFPHSIREVTVDRSLITVLGLTVLFKFLIEIVYFVFLVTYRDFPVVFNPTKYLVGFGLTLALAFIIFVQTRDRPIMRVALTLFFVFTIVPVLSYFGITDKSAVYSALVISSFLVMLQFSRLPLIDLKQRSKLTRRTTTLLVGMAVTHTVVIYAALVYWYGSPPISPLFFENTYEIRAATEPMFPSIRMLGAPAFGYFLSWQIKVFNPFLLGFFLKNRRYLVASGVGALAILAYMYAPNTLHLAVPVLTITVLLLFRLKVLMIGILTLGIIGVVSGYLLLHYADILQLVNQVVGRALYIEARNDFFLYQWFQMNPHIYLTDSPLNPFWEYPYDTRHTYLYAERFLGSSHNATVGFLADAYGQFGAVGMLVTGAAVGAILWVLDSFAVRSDPEMVVVLATTAIFNLNQSDLTSNLLTNGLMLVVVIAFLYAADERKLKGISGRAARASAED